MNYMLDSNAITLLLDNRHRSERLRFNAALDSAAVSAVVLFELRYGLAKSQSRAVNERELDEFLSSGIEIVPFTEQDAQTAGTLRATLEASGQLIGAYNILIAAQALRVGATLVTTDSDFARVDGLKIEDWSKP